MDPYAEFENLVREMRTFQRIAARTNAREMRHRAATLEAYVDAALDQFAAASTRYCDTGRPTAQESEQ